MSHPSSVSRVSSRSSFFSSSLFADLTRESCLLLIGGAIGSFMLAYSTMKAHWTQRDTVRGVRGVDLEEHLRALMARHTAKKRKKATAKNQAKPPPHQSSDTSKSNNKDDEDDGIIIRAPRWDEAEMEAIALQMHESFNNFNRSVGLPDEFYSFDLSRWVIKDCMTNDVGLVAFSADGEAIGSCFNQEFDIEEGAVGCGPWSAKWGALQQGIGRKLIGEILQQSIRHGAKGIRLMQISANLTSFSLYTSLGFVSREPIVMWRGYLAPEFMEAALKLGDEMGLATRTLVERDIATCDAIHREALGISRAKVLKKDLTSTYVKQIVVLNKKGKIIGYNTGMTVNGHTVVPDLPTLQFTIATAMSQHRAGEPDEPPFMHTCARLYPEIDRWLLQAGVKIERIDNNMCLGEWQPIKHEKYIYCSAVTY